MSGSLAGRESHFFDCCVMATVAASAAVSRPVIKAEAGLSLVIADGVETASAAVRLVAAGERVSESHTQHMPSGQFEQKKAHPLTG